MRHRFHAICPYFAMFPEGFVQKHLVWSKPGELVLDPFSGRGTTVFESLLNGRRAIGCDTNAVAVCLSNAKADPPTRKQALDRLREIEAAPIKDEDDPVWGDPFFDACFHPETLRELLHLRSHLVWSSRRADRFIAAVTLGALHGESHRSERYLSNRMPRTVSTKPDYSVRWWTERNCTAPRRHTFKVLRDLIEYRFESDPPEMRGRVKHTDVRRAASQFRTHQGEVSLVITSPPYLDTTNFEEDQWLRLWFLGGPTRPRRQGRSDDRHTHAAKYWTFLKESWKGIGPLLRDDARLVVRIGGKKFDQGQIKEGLVTSLEEGLGRSVVLVDEMSSDITGGQLKIFRPGAEGAKCEYDFRFALA